LRFFCMDQHWIIAGIECLNLVDHLCGAPYVANDFHMKFYTGLAREDVFF
jgi:hypothetical protein